MENLRNRVWKEVKFYQKALVEAGLSDQVNTLPTMIDWDAVDRLDAMITADYPNAKGMRDMVVSGALRDMEDFARAGLGWDD